MIFPGISMWVLSAIYFMNDNSQYIPLIVFGFLAITLGYADFRVYEHKVATGKVRISSHLTNMLGGAIAMITAVLVVNPPVDLEWVWWVFPTALITPLIFWWNYKTLSAQS